MNQDFNQEVNRQYNKPFNRPHQKNRYAIWFIILGILAIIGIVGASRYQLKRPNTVSEQADIQDAIITEIRLGRLLRPEEATKKNPKIKQQESYTTEDPLVMRITTDPSVKNPVQLGVRLLTQAGSIVELSPSSVEFQPGTTGYCCWQVDQPGRYTMQIFRPEKVISTIPLTIQEALKSPTGNANIQIFN